MLKVAGYYYCVFCTGFVLHRSALGRKKVRRMSDFRKKFRNYCYGLLYACSMHALCSIILYSRLELRHAEKKILAFFKHFDCSKKKMLPQL